MNFTNGVHQDLSNSKTEALFGTALRNVENFMNSMIAVIDRNCEMVWMDPGGVCVTFAVIFG